MEAGQAREIADNERHAIPNPIRRGEPMKRPCLFLDRDGVLIEDLGYVGRAEDVRPIPGAFAAVARARRAGLAVVVVTNQSGIGRGYYGEADYRRVQAEVEARLRAEGGGLDGAYHCPFHPEGQEPFRHPDHEDRKPNPGMLLRAARELGLDLGRSLMVGDKRGDLEAGARAGVGWVALVRTGEGTAESASVRAGDFAPAEVWRCADLAEAVDRFLALSPPPWGS